MNQISAVKRAKLLARTERKRVYDLVVAGRDLTDFEKKYGERGPTPETKAKLQPHAIERLQARGVIDDAGERHLDEIARAYALITAPVRLKLSSVERVDGSRTSCVTEGDIELVRRYERWWDELVRTSQQKCFYPVHDVAVDGLGFSEIGAKTGRHQVTISKWFKAGLAAYHDANRTKK